MSYVRWGSDGSNVYVYDAGDCFECCCGKKGSLGTRTEMINHLVKHVKKDKYKVPLRVFKAFLWERKHYGETARFNYETGKPEEPDLKSTSTDDKQEK